MLKNYFIKYLKEIEPRINWLKSNDKYLEIIFFLSVTLEQEIDSLINRYDIYASKILEDKKIIFSPKKDRKNNSTLGIKFNQLKVYLDDKEINSIIEKFIDIRNKATHKIYDHDISNFELEIKKELNSFYKVLSLLVSKNISLIEEEKLILKRKLRTTKRKILKND